jgi:glycosyltransferase involved in cell wall biosynthesis
MPTVALVNGGGEFAGTTVSLRPYPDALHEAGFRVRWYQCIDFGTHPYGPAGACFVNGLGVPNSTWDMGINRLWVFPHRLRDVREDIVFLSDPTMLRIARRNRVRVVKVHDLRPLTPWADRRLTSIMFRYVLPQLRNLNRIIVPTHAVASDLAAQGLDSSGIRVVPDTSGMAYHPEHVSASLARIRDSGTLRVLYVANDRPWKNLGFVIRLARELELTAGPVRFRFTLLSHVRPETSQMLANSRLASFHVISSVRSVEGIYQEHDVLVHPSLYEGFGRPVLEAMTFGMPVVVNRIPSLIELVANSGILLSVESVGPWAEALASLGDPSTYERWGRTSLARSRAYSPAHFRAAACRAFEDLV